MLKKIIEEGKLFLEEPDKDGGVEYVNSNNLRAFVYWTSKTMLFLQETYQGHPMVSTFKQIIEADRRNCYITTLDELIGILMAFETIKPNNSKLDYDAIIHNIFERFQNCALQLMRRHDDRDTLVIKDEYDVQDLLHALLRLNFSDVRPEEWTPSYAGNCNRMDFLLKEAKIAIEVKMSRRNLKDKEIGNQLIIDITKYKQHPDVKFLYCFVYDPDRNIYNPTGLENDLKRLSSNDLKVYVMVRPS